MADYTLSKVIYDSKRRSRCGYCSSFDGSNFYGLHAFTLRTEDYQNMIDRGWRRCGKYCYKADMKDCCCPLYTIRCAAKEFRLSKSQKKIIKKFNNFLINGTVPQDKVHKSTEIMQPNEINFLNDNLKNVTDEAVVSCDASVKALINQVKEESQLESKKKVEEITTDISNTQGKATKNKSMKAKQKRIQRKREKLQKLGLTEEEISKKMVEKKKYPVVKTIEDYIKETESKKTVHNLKICLVRSCPRSETFDSTFPVSFDLYKKYQTFIHKSAPRSLTESKYTDFLVNSPLQIKLVLVKSPEFEKSFKESAMLFAKYQNAIHHEPYENSDAIKFKNFLIDSPLESFREYGSYHQQYWLDDKLIAVGVIDILPKCVSSVYFYYDSDYSFLSLGTYGALREIEFTRKLSSRFPDLVYYYMGFYIHSCVKMKYKSAFKPSYLLCPEVFSWHPIQNCIPKLEISKYSRLNEDPNAQDDNADITVSDVLILHRTTPMLLSNFLKKRNLDVEELGDIMEYAKVIGKTCAKKMLLCRL